MENIRKRPACHVLKIPSVDPVLKFSPSGILLSARKCLNNTFVEDSQFSLHMMFVVLGMLSACVVVLCVVSIV